MKDLELIHLISAVLVLGIVISFSELIKSNFLALGTGILFASIIIGANIIGKKWAAYSLDLSVEHKTLFWARFGFVRNWYLEKAVPLGAILPLVLSAFSLGIIKFMGILTYQTSALQRRAARRFGRYSFTEVTDIHNALVGAGGIVASLLLAFVAYWIPSLEELARMSAFYAFWNIIPISRLDGTQIFFGSKVIWTILAIICVIFIAYAILLGAY